MRTAVWALLIASATASADDGGSLRVRTTHEGRDHDEPLLHLDGVLLDPTIGEGGISDRQGIVIELGPRARLAAEGQSWQTGLSPSGYDDQLRLHGWRAGGELSYDLGWFSIGANVSMTREPGVTRRTAGLFAYRTFRLSRWMHAWIALGLSFEQVTEDGTPPRQGMNLGLSLGTTFR